MNILLVAPQPFYQDRGTPIAVDLLVKALSEQGHTIDLLVFNEGEERHYPRVTIHRVQSIPAVEGIKPGFGLKKLYLDFWLFFRMISLLRKGRYDVVHAVEESVFFAMLLRPFFGYQYINDIDSSMTTQMVEKYGFLRPIEKAFSYIESLPMRRADAVVPMCDAFAVEAGKYRDEGIFVLKDIDIAATQNTSVDSEDLRVVFATPSDTLFMYIGNLESYQGIDLLIESFALAVGNGSKANLMIIGGDPADVTRYKAKTETLQINQRCVLVGKRPVSGLSTYMAQADVLVSPRTQGINTPMKVYTYLASGKPVLATRLPTHTQVMDDDTAVLVEPEAADFSKAINEMAADIETFQQRATAAKKLIEEHHSYASFCDTLAQIYGYLQAQRPNELNS